MIKDTIFSPCREYRYTLYREWMPGDKVVQFIGLNPSTADEVKNDPTVTRCINYAKAWGYTGMYMTNIFAFRETDPNEYKTAEEHFLAQIIIRVVQLHLERRKNEAWIRLPRSTASRNELELKNKAIKTKISLLSDTFKNQCTLPLHRAAFNHDTANNLD